MSKMRLLLFGKALFALSFLFFFCAFYMQFKEEQSFSDPIRDVLSLPNDDKIIISTVNQGDIVISSSEKNDEFDSDFREDNNFEIVNPLESENNILRDKIEKKYGIKVKYGVQTNNYFIGDLKVISISDDENIRRGLQELENALALYPIDFFKEFNKLGFNLNVLLIQKYDSANVTGITELYDDVVNISISMDYPFNESFHHEVYHYIEHFIEKKGGKFSIWNTFNPSNFIYGDIDSNLSFNQTLMPDAFFVNNYAQSSADEDRASTFEYMTADSKYVCYNSRKYPIWKKSYYMSLMIDTYFDTVDSEVIEYWERFIY